MRTHTVFLVALVLVASAPVARVRPSVDGAALFATQEPLNLTLDAPLGRLFARRPPGDQMAVPGRLSYTEEGATHALAVVVSLRGNTSRDAGECTFPKLKVKFADPQAVGQSLFRGNLSLKIGTHCGDRPDGDLTNDDRWANEKSPVREAFVYRLLAAMDVPTLLARPARITYVDPGRDGAPLVRNAMLLEDTDAAMHRLGATRELIAPDGDRDDPHGSGPADRFHDAAHDFTPADTARLAFAEAMIGNFDWFLRFTPDDHYRADADRPLWNLLAFIRGDGRAIPVMYDFDVAGMVSGRHGWFPHVLTRDFEPGATEARIEVLSQVQHTRSLFPRAVLDATRRHFLERRQAAYRTADGARLDPQGASFARAYLDAFFDAIARDEAFYRPVITASTRLFEDGGASRTACTTPAPAGTLVGATGAESAEFLQAPVLDVRWHFLGRAHCTAILHGPVWVPKASVGTAYP